MITATRSGADASPWPPRTLTLCFLALILSILCGCANSAKPAISSIVFYTGNPGEPVSPQPAADPSQPLNVLENGTAYLVATVTNDNESLGVSWTVTCGSAVASGGTGTGTANTAPSCGFFTPAQTASGPVPTYNYPGTIITTYTAPSTIPTGGIVTITAHATALPSITSSVTLTIVAEKAASPATAGLAGGTKRTVQGAGM